MFHMRSEYTLQYSVLLLLLADGQLAMQIYEGQVHGFALRSNWSSDKDKKAMDDTEKQGIEWFNSTKSPTLVFPSKYSSLTICLTRVPIIEI